jgi:hypothetical protein
MNTWKIIIAVCSLLELATLVKWLADGRQILTKQQMVVERIVRDEVFGTNITKTEFIDGFWLGLDVAAPICVTFGFIIAFCIWKLRR